MLIALNVAGVLAQPPTKVRDHVRQFADIMEFAFSDDEIAGLGSFEDVYKSEAAQTYIARRLETGRMILEEVAQQAWLFAHTAMPGALAAVHAISEIGRIIYLTSAVDARLSYVQHWLRLHGFPASDQVFSARFPAQKLLIASEQRQRGEKARLIDDNLSSVFESFPTLFRSQREKGKWAIRTVGMISFGKPCLPPQELAHYFTIPMLRSWDFVDEIEELVV